MASLTEHASAFACFQSIPEMLENVLLYLADSQILFTRQVCKRWDDVIRDSSALRRRLWYDKDLVLQTVDEHNNTLNPGDIIHWNPFITRLGLSMSGDGIVECPFKPLRFLHGQPFPRCPIYDTPGSWTTMLATQPSYQFFLIRCFANPSWRWPERRTVYIVESLRRDGLLLGELLATLAEAWDRQQRGIDRYRGISHTRVSVVPCVDLPILRPQQDCNAAEDWELLNLQDDSADVKVVVHQANDVADAAFSLKQARSQPPAKLSPAARASFRLLKTDYPMDYRWAGWHTLLRIHTGYAGNLLESWRPFDPLSRWLGRACRKFDGFTQVKQSQRSLSAGEIEIQKTLRDPRTCGLVAELAQKLDMCLPPISVSSRGQGHFCDRHRTFHSPKHSHDP